MLPKIRQATHNESGEEGEAINITLVFLCVLIYLAYILVRHMFA